MLRGINLGSAMFASYHGLDNLIVIIDRNDLCILGKTEDLGAGGFRG